MRLLCIFAICVIASVNVFAEDLQLLPDKNGFGGIKWGTEFSDKLGMTDCIDYGNRILCNKTNEEVTELAGVPMTVNYAFFGGYFNLVSFEFENIYDWTKIIELLTQTYGKNENGEGFRYNNRPAGLFSVHNFYSAKKQLFVVQGILFDGDIDKLDAAIKKRSEAMALSIFTDAERKNLAGFFGYKWGDSVDKVSKDMLLVYSYQNTKIYIKKEQSYFGPTPVDLIEYTFIDNKLVEIEISADIPDSWFVRILEVNFGKFDYFQNIHYKNLPNTTINIHKYGSGTIITAEDVNTMRAIREAKK